jgi:hypothetical protein
VKPSGECDHGRGLLRTTRDADADADAHQLRWGEPDDAGRTIAHHAQCRATIALLDVVELHHTNQQGATILHRHRAEHRGS